MGVFFDKYTYCAVTFDGQNEYWYRSNSVGYHIGDAVIVPITDSCKWGKGTITKVQKFSADNVPYPLEKTKGVVSKLGIFGENKIKKHNRDLQNSEYVLDISVLKLKTPTDCFEIITTEKERRHFRQSKIYNGCFLVESCPPAVPEQILKRPEAVKQKMRLFVENRTLPDEIAMIKLSKANPLEK